MVLVRCHLGSFASRTTDASTFCVTVVQEEKPWQMLPRPKLRCQLSLRFWGFVKAVEHLVVTLPPKERACVLLKDVFDYTLEEIAGARRIDCGWGQGCAEARAIEAGGISGSLEIGTNSRPGIDACPAPLCRAFQQPRLEQLTRVDQRRRAPESNRRLCWQAGRCALFRQLRAVGDALEDGGGRSRWRTGGDHIAARC